MFYCYKAILALNHAHNRVSVLISRLTRCLFSMPEEFATALIEFG